MSTHRTITFSTDPPTDPLAHLDVPLEAIREARHVIDPVFLDSPQFEDDALSADLGRRVLVKVETANPIRCFKARGVSTALQELADTEPEVREVVCSSSGNFGAAMAYVGRARGLRVVVFTDRQLNPDKRARMESFGARIEPADDPRVAADRYLEEHPDARLVQDGKLASVAVGAGTLGIELAAAGHLDTVVLPVGDGSLLTGVARWLRHVSPDTRIVGVNPADAPTMHDSLRAGEPVTRTPTSGMAEGITVTRPWPESLPRVRALVDDVVLVSDEELLDAMELLARRLGMLVEPAAAAATAAVATGRVAGDRVAVLLSGANPSPAVRARLAARLAADPAA